MLPRRNKQQKENNAPRSHARAKTVVVIDCTNPTKPSTLVGPKLTLEDSFPLLRIPLSDRSSVQPRASTPRKREEPALVCASNARSKTPTNAAAAESVLPTWLTDRLGPRAKPMASAARRTPTPAAATAAAAAVSVAGGRTKCGEPRAMGGGARRPSIASTSSSGGSNRTGTPAAPTSSTPPSNRQDCSSIHSLELSPIRTASQASSSSTSSPPDFKFIRAAESQPDDSLRGGLHTLRAEVLVCNQEMGTIITRVHMAQDKEQVLMDAFAGIKEVVLGLLRHKGLTTLTGYTWPLAASDMPLIPVERRPSLLLALQEMIIAYDMAPMKRSPVLSAITEITLNTPWLIAMARLCAQPPISGTRTWDPELCDAALLC